MEERNEHSRDQSRWPTQPDKGPAESRQNHARVERMPDFCIDPVLDEPCVSDGFRKGAEVFPQCDRSSDRAPHSNDQQ